MKVKTAYSQKENIYELVKDIKNQIGNFKPSLLNFYVSPKYKGNEISKLIYDAFGNTPTIGCTTAGELISGKMLEDSVVVMALGPDIIEDVKIEVLENIANDSNVVNNAFLSFSQYYNTPMSTMDVNKYVGLALIDGLSLKEEKIIERINDLTNVDFVGGSAGDGFLGLQTIVYANGRSYTNAGVLALIKTKVEFSVLKTQSFSGVGKIVKITDVDEPNRLVHSMNNENAKSAYTKLVGKNDLDMEKWFPKYALGIKIGENDYFVRSPMRFVGDSISFACAIKKDMELELIEAQDITETTKVDLENKIKEMKEVSAIINFNCTFRYSELKSNNQLEQYANLFKDIPTIGFNCYGECYIGHLNQTSTMLIFK